MVKATLLSLILFSLPAMADSINILAYSNWTTIGNVSIYGVDSLSYLKTVPLASVSADVTMGGSNGEYTITGSIYSSQGYGTGPSNPQTSSRASISLDLPADSGNWLYTVNDQVTDSERPGPGDYTCQMGGQGMLSELSCSAPMTSSQFNHDPGTPLRVAFLFGGGPQQYGQTFQEQFSVTLSEIGGGSEPPVTTPTPEPSAFALLGLPLAGFAILRRRLTLSCPNNTSA